MIPKDRMISKMWSLRSSIQALIQMLQNDVISPEQGYHGLRACFTAEFAQKPSHADPDTGEIPDDE